MLNIMRRFFGRQTPMTEGWSNPLFEPACTRLVQARKEDAHLRQRFQNLAAMNTYEAAVERDEIRRRLDALVVEIASYERDVEREAEYEAGVRQLQPVHAMRVGSLEKWLEGAVMNPDAMSLDEWMAGTRLNREVERLRLALREATGDEEYARPFDAIAQLRAYWDGVTRDRERLIAQTGPGHKVQTGPLPWFPLADRLARLRAGTVRKAYAIR